MRKPDVLRPVDDDSRRVAKSLIRSSRFAALACLEPETGVPLASQVNIATDSDGRPCFLISQLSAHFGAIATDARCSLLIGTPGKGDPAAHSRLTYAGHAERLTDAEDIARVRRRFLGKHPKSELYVDFGDFAFWRVTPTAVSLNAGFGKAYELSGDDVLTDVAGCAGFNELEAGAVEHMNDDHRDAVANYATALLNQPAGNWALASIDPEGLDLANGDAIARLWFEPALASAEDLRPLLVDLAKQARAGTDQSA